MKVVPTAQAEMRSKLVERKVRHNLSHVVYLAAERAHKAGGRDLFYYSAKK